ncbi:MAG TPA: HlyD family efflux transporter periplasmic adaptor subunit [Gemmatimonas sp.]|nr:HlyD family efflux transporter periplasmic adaptor subunit [Gemmatimonas sp.]
MALTPELSTTPDGRPLRTARLLRAETSYRIVWIWLGSITLVLLLVLFLPWQQNVQGTGTVSALSPQDRAQSLPSRIDGRIERWLVAEGAFVKAGTPIVEISEIKDEYLDPAVVERTAEQLDAKSESNAGKRAKAAALARQIEALEQSLEFKRGQTRTKVEQYAAAVTQAVLDDSLARDQYARREALYNSPLGLVSLNDLQAARQRAQAATARLVEKRGDLSNSRVDLEGIEAEYREKIEKAIGDRMSTLSEVQDGIGEVSKLRNKVASLKVRQGYYSIDAPQDGYVVRAIKYGVGELVKAGDPIVTVQPTAERRAVELYVRAVDVPLLRRGRKVRLEFDGWPSLQFSGWPSVSVGTFGGEVAVIDQFVSPDGRFRVLVVPDPADEPWPAQLRLGSGVRGWAALDTVRVWFELWRQLNGFPPSIKPADAETVDPKSAKSGSKA